MALTKVKAGNILLTTPGASSNDVTPATTQYVTTALANLADSAPSTLNTLNELAAALGDDANFSTTVTNSIAAKLPLAGGTMTGGLISSGSNTGTNPAANGHIANELQFFNTSATDNNLNGIGFFNSNNSVDARIAGVHKSHSSRHGEIAFLTHDGSALVERMRVGSSGTVLVGKTAEGTATDGIELNRQDVIVATRNGDSPLILNRRTSDGDIALFRKDNSTVGSIGANGGYIYAGSGDTNIRFHAGADAILPANAGGASRSAAIDLGTSGAKFKDLYTSGTIETAQIDISINTNARMYSSAALSEVGTGTFALQVVNAAGSALKPLGFRAEDIRFATGSSERMRIDSSGRVGIAQDAPGDFNSGADDLVIGNSGGHFGITIRTGTGNTGSIFFADGVSGSQTYMGAIQYNHNDDALVFGTNGGSERMRITSAGHIAMTSGKRFYFNVNSIGNGDTYIDEYSANEVGITTGGSRKFALSGGNLYHTGSLNSNHNFSDERLKENIVVIPNALEKVSSLRGITFTRKDDGSVGTGLIAQELQKVLPEAVYESKTIDSLEDSDAEEYKAIRYGTTVGLLVEAIKEQQTLIESLTARITTLEG